MALACELQHNICMDRRDLIPRVFDLSYDSTASKCRDREKVEEVKLLMWENQLLGTFGVKDNITRNN